jgi:hypothetical protein
MRLIRSCFVLVCPSDNTHWTEFCVIIRGNSYRTLSRKPKFGSNRTKLTDTAHGDVRKTLLLFSRLYDVSIFLRPFRHYAIFLLHLFLSVQSSSRNPFSPIIPLIPSAQISLGLPRFLLPDGHHSSTSYEKKHTKQIFKIFLGSEVSSNICRVNQNTPSLSNICLPKIESLTFRNRASYI